MIPCGDSGKKEEDAFRLWKYSQPAGKEVHNTETTETGGTVDLSNKRIGTITSIILDAEIDLDRVASGADIFKSVRSVTNWARNWSEQFWVGYRSAFLRNG